MGGYPRLSTNTADHPAKWGPSRRGTAGNRAMKPLAKSDRAKLAKFLALLGSDREGEALAAARAAARLVKLRGISWRDLIEPAAVEKALPELGTWR